MNRKSLLKLIGKELYLLPIENSLSRVRGRSLESQIKKDILVGVGTSLFHLEKEGKYNIISHINSRGYGFIPFETKQDLLDYIELNKYIQKLRYEIDLSHLTIKDVRDIKVIIDNSIINSKRKEK